MADACGLGPCFRPAWLRRFATPRCFLIVYGLLGTIQTMAYVYFVATLTTLEKRFKIPSKTTGIMISGNEISQILLSLSLSYYGGQGNRPLWIAWGVALSGLSCYILVLPHLVYGPGQHALALTKEFLDTHVYNGTTNRTSDGTCLGERAPHECHDDGLGEYSVMPLILVFLSQFVLGIGSTMYYALGQPYLDDNVKKTKTPMLLGWVLAFRTLGPAVGLGLGAACLRVYIDPSLSPVITRKDPRWLGAWWLGWVILGTTMLAFSFMIAMFPKKLPKLGSALSLHDSPSSNPSPLPNEDQPLTKSMLSDFMPNDPISKKQDMLLREMSDTGNEDFSTALRRLLKNTLLMVNIVASVFYILAASAYLTFMIKYLETQYQQSASGASGVAGAAGILATVVGFLVSGYFISKYKPRSTYVLGWNVIVGFVYIASEIIFIFLGCTDNGFQGLNPSTGEINLLNSCNTPCHCDKLKYTPVCAPSTGVTYYSACHAGCYTKLNNSKEYSDCRCLSSPGNLMDADGYSGGNNTIFNTVTSGLCPLNCGKNFILFIVTVCIMHCLGSSGKIGNILVNYRCVAPKDKSFAQGLALVFLSLLAFIPGPILFGAIIDSTCLLWDETCGNKGNCWLYHRDNFRLYLNLTAAGLTAVGVLLDIVVWRLGRNLDLYGEPDEKSPQTETRKQSFQQLK